MIYIKSKQQEQTAYSACFKNKINNNSTKQTEVVFG